MLPPEEIETSVPVLLIAKSWETPESPLSVVIPAPAIPRACQVEPLFTKSWFKVVS